jgi:16S rRNA (adenine1518-N6/adenine1519-N6)-dimethyltransferase
MELPLTGKQAGSTSTSSHSRTRGSTARPRAKKQFGQHFLSDSNILESIAEASGVSKNDIVIEVGPGLGALTEVLARRAGRVIAVEIDADLLPLLRARFQSTSNVALVEVDMLEVTPAQVLERGGGNAPYRVVANLPYNIAAALLRLFLEGTPPPASLTVMVQLEVAESLVSAPGKMTLLGVATQVYAEGRIVKRVAPGSFNPPPAVHSAVVHLDVLAKPRVDVPIGKFFRVVRAGFGNPRKQLRNSLSYGLRIKQETVDQIMADAGVDAMLRPQVLSIAQWQSITSSWLHHLASL